MLNVHRKVLGMYEYHENKVVGKGTNSVVYQGKKMNTSENVCIKQITIKTTMAEKFARSEIELLKRVNHQNVLKYVAHFERGIYLYIVTELCDSNLLTKIKNRGTKNSEIDTLHLFAQILEGYQELRSKGYIHRDIKPENILIKNRTVKLGDFGYSSILKRSLIKEPFNVGTPLYMAPESLLSNTYSQKSDIWSLGVTLHELLHGVTPFTSQTEEELKKELRKPLKFNVCSQQIMNLIANCLTYDVQSRFDLQKLLHETKLAINQLTEMDQRRKHE